MLMEDRLCVRQRVAARCKLVGSADSVDLFTASCSRRMPQFHDKKQLDRQKLRLARPRSDLGCTGEYCCSLRWGDRCHRRTVRRGLGCESLHSQKLALSWVDAK